MLWAALATLIPAVISVLLLTNSTPLIVSGTQVVDVVRTIGYRNIGFSLVLAVALFTQPKRVVAFLLMARGLTEWGDALGGIFTAPTAVPCIGGLGDLLVGFYFLRKSAS